MSAYQRVTCPDCGQVGVIGPNDWPATWLRSHQLANARHPMHRCDRCTEWGASLGADNAYLCPPCARDAARDGRPLRLLHLTETGPFAGTPVCGAPRNDRDRYQHPAYDGEQYRAQLADPTLCPECRFHETYQGDTDLFAACDGPVCRAVFP